MPLRRMLVSGKAGKSKESGNDQTAQASQKIRRADPYNLGRGEKNIIAWWEDLPDPLKAPGIDKDDAMRF
jgi:hypothetical protein